MIAILMVLIVQ